MALMVIAGCGGGNDTCESPPPDQAVWESRMGKYAGKLMKLRVNKALADLAGQSCFTWQIAAGVQVKKPEKNGMPSEKEQEYLLRVEERLIRHFTQDGLAVYAVDIRSDKRCDYIFYGNGKKKIEQAVESLGDTIEGYSVEITVKPDKHWITYTWFAPFGIHNPYD